MKIHSSLFCSKIPNKKITVRLMGRCVLWTKKYSTYIQFNINTMNTYFFKAPGLQSYAVYLFLLSQSGPTFISYWTQNTFPPFFSSLHRPARIHVKVKFTQVEYHVSRGVTVLFTVTNVRTSISHMIFSLSIIK
jgi:hypothetical protein